MTVDKNSKLTSKQQKFVTEYIKDFNGAQAAIRAGYSEKTARVQASGLLSKPNVQHKIRTHLDRAEKKSDITREKVLKELMRIAFFDISRLFDEHGNLVNVQDIDEDTRRAVASLEINELFDGYGERKTKIGIAKKIKMSDKLRALELLGRHLTLFKDRVVLEDGSRFASMSIRDKISLLTASVEGDESE